MTSVPNERLKYTLTHASYTEFFFRSVRVSKLLEST